jgi:predicted dehydrogenase
MKMIGISMVGSGFMGKLHSLAIQSYPVYYYPPVLQVKKVALVDSNEKIASEGRERFGFARAETDWRKIVNDPQTDVIVVAVPNNLHKPIAMAAIKAGKHVFCEKPLAINAQESYDLYQAAKKAHVIHAVGHNNRALSGIRFLKKLMNGGELGTIYSIQMRYIQSWGMNPETPMQWRFDIERSGSGTLGDTGSHAIDIGRYLLGDVKKVISLNKTYISDRNIIKDALLSSVVSTDLITGKQKVTVDDDTKSIFEFESGATGFLWSSRFCLGHEDTLDIEVYGSKGSARFSREAPNELSFCSLVDREDIRGIKKIKMGPCHPNGELWPMADLGVGYVEQKCVEYKDFFEAIVKNDPTLVSTSFYDGYKVCQVIEAIQKSDDEKRWVTVNEIKCCDER